MHLHGKSNLESIEKNLEYLPESLKIFLSSMFSERVSRKTIINWASTISFKSRGYTCHYPHAMKGTVPIYRSNIMIYIVCNVLKIFKRNSTVPRVNVDIEELKKLANIDIKLYGLGLNIQSPLKYKKLPPVQATSFSEDISLRIRIVTSGFF
jgi:hypothetical protein